MSAVVYVVRGETWHAVGEFSKIFDTPAMIRAIKERYPTHNVSIYPDASGNSRKSVDASISDISLLESAHFAVYANKKNPLVKDRIISTNTRFEQKKLFINAIECPEYSRCMLQLAYGINGEPDKKTNLDHLPDAGTYPIAFEFPTVKPAANINIRFAL